jgi:hypothetical protein
VRTRGGVHRAVHSTAAAQLGIGRGHDRVDILMRDVAAYQFDLHAPIIVEAWARMCG